MKTMLSLLLFLFMGISLQATETNLIIRVKAKDAKFVGSSLGGALVILKDKMSGQILAKGKTEGSTGNTGLIMKTAHERGQRISDENTAKFMATVDIEEPTFVTIEVYSPGNHKQAQVHAQTELWLIPGKHIMGDGIIVEIPGFIVDVLEPRTHQYMALDKVKGSPVKLQANIVMMCGCTISKGGLWDAEQMEVKAIIKRNGEKWKTIPLKWVAANLFEAELELDEAGQYEATVYAYDESAGNTGVDEVNFIID